VQQTALQERPHEDPTIGILVVQVRRIRAISGVVFRRPNAAFVMAHIRTAASGGGLCYFLIPRSSPA
jgi:hypothetical protein